MSTFRSEINRVLKDRMSADSDVVVLGQSIRDPYGGAFKVTRGLTRHFDDRIIDLPISEASSIGLAVGMSLEGYLPVVEIMFSDFLTLCVDQVFNGIVKFNDMYDLKARVIIRAATGAGRAYGSTHSQNMEAFFLAIPHVAIFTPGLYTSFDQMYTEAFEHEGASLIVEEKLLYDLEMRATEKNDFTDSVLDVATYGCFAHIVRDLADKYPINPVLFDRIKPLPEFNAGNKTCLVVEPSYCDQTFASWFAWKAGRKYEQLHFLGAVQPTLPCNPEDERRCIVNAERIEQEIKRVLKARHA